jgi:hypothetical protein
MYSQKLKNSILGITAIISIAGTLFFPSSGTIQPFVSGIVFLLVFPYLVTRFILKESPRVYGFTLPLFTKKRSLQALFLFLLSLGLFFLLFIYTPLGHHYFPPKFLSEQFLFFFLYSILGGGAFSLMYSSFFQGFLFFALEPITKEWTILIQWFCFIVFLAITGTFGWDMTLYLYVALFSGALVRLSRSFFSGFIFTWAFVILVDMILLKFF